MSSIKMAKEDKMNAKNEKKKLGMLTLGCKVNQYESRGVAEIMALKGYETVDFTERADVYIINTCTVTGMSDKKSRQMIRRTKKLNKNSVLAVMGCYSQVSPDEIKKLPEVDIIWGTKERSLLADRIEDFIAEKKYGKEERIISDMHMNRTYDDLQVSGFGEKTRAYIKVEEGCDRFCSYCIIPYARGPICSRAYDDILEEAGVLARAGYKEVVVIGINLAAYGKDTEDKQSLCDVLEGINALDGIERIRLGSMEPDMIDDEFIEMLRRCNKVCSHFHMSVQSGCSATLARMRRRYNAEDYRKYVKRIREVRKNAAITTDMMVGFPGETEEEFEQSLTFANEIGFASMHVFKYSPRKGTPAAAASEQVPEEVKNERSNRMIAAAHENAKAYNSALIGACVEVLAETQSEEREGYYEGHTDNYVKVFFCSEEDKIGKIVPVNIVSADGFGCVGTLAKK